MNGLTSLEILSNIEGATSSEAIEQFFETIRSITAEKKTINRLSGNAISTEDLREDIVVEASDLEKQIIIDNFPEQKNNYLVVTKVMEE